MHSILYKHLELNFEVSVSFSFSFVFKIHYLFFLFFKKQIFSSGLLGERNADVSLCYQNGWPGVIFHWKKISSTLLNLWANCVCLHMQFSMSSSHKHGVKSLCSVHFYFSNFSYRQMDIKFPNWQVERIFKLTLVHSILCHQGGIACTISLTIANCLLELESPLHFYLFALNWNFFFY